MITVDDEAENTTATPKGPAAEKKKAPRQRAAPSAGLLGLSKMTLLLLIAINLFLTSGGICIYDRFFAQKVVALDIKGYLVQQRDLYLTHKIDEKQFEKNLDALDAAVKRTPKNKIIVMGDAVVRPAEVITP
jgi:hypothetical protein